MKDTTNNNIENEITEQNKYSCSVVGYCRTATKNDVQFNSIDIQKERIKAYAKEKNYNLIGFYADEGVSGFCNKNKTEFNNMMADSKNGGFDKIIVCDVSRLSRSTIDFINCIAAMKEHGIALECVSSKSNDYINDNTNIDSLLDSIGKPDSSEYE